MKEHTGDAPPSSSKDAVEAVLTRAILDAQDEINALGIRLERQGQSMVLIGEDIERRRAEVAELKAARVMWLTSRVQQGAGAEAS